MSTWDRNGYGIWEVSKCTSSPICGINPTVLCSAFSLWTHLVFQGIVDWEPSKKVAKGEGKVAPLLLLKDQQKRYHKLWNFSYRFALPQLMWALMDTLTWEPLKKAKRQKSLFSFKETQNATIEWKQCNFWQWCILFQQRDQLKWSNTILESLLCGIYLACLSTSICLLHQNWRTDPFCWRSTPKTIFCSGLVLLVRGKKSLRSFIVGRTAQELQEYYSSLHFQAHALVQTEHVLAWWSVCFCL